MISVSSHDANQKVIDSTGCLKIDILQVSEEGFVYAYDGPNEPYLTYCEGCDESGAYGTWTYEPFKTAEAALAAAMEGFSEGVEFVPTEEEDNFGI